MEQFVLELHGQAETSCYLFRLAAVNASVCWDPTLLLWKADDFLAFSQHRSPEQ